MQKNGQTLRKKGENMCTNLYKLANGMNASLLAMACGRLGVRLDELFPGFRDVFTYDEDYPHIDNYDLLAMVKLKKGFKCASFSKPDCKCPRCTILSLMNQHSWIRAVSWREDHAMILIQYTKKQKQLTDQEIGDNMLQLFDPKHMAKLKAQVREYE